MLYVSASKIVSASRATDRAARVRKMARTMQEAAAAHGSCDLAHLRAAGFTTAEALAFADEARAILSGRPPGAVNLAASEAARLIGEARKIRRRVRARARRAVRIQ